MKVVEKGSRKTKNMAIVQRLQQQKCSTENNKKYG